MTCIADGLGAKRPGSIPAAPVNWYLRLSSAIARYTGVDVPLVAGARFLSSDRRIDLTRAIRDLGFQPEIGCASR